MTYIIEEPAKAEIRGSNSLALPEGRVRRITAAATSNINQIVESRMQYGSRKRNRWVRS